MQISDPNEVSAEVTENGSIGVRLWKMARLSPQVGDKMCMWKVAEVTVSSEEMRLGLTMEKSVFLNGKFH